MSIRYFERLGEAGITALRWVPRATPMTTRPAETINGLYKAALIHRRGPWKTKAAVELATLEWVAWFNHQQLLESIGDIPPTEAEQRYYQALAAPAAKAVLL